MEVLPSYAPSECFQALERSPWSLRSEVKRNPWPFLNAAYAHAGVERTHLLTSAASILFAC